jgi:hypothetical protein
VVFSKIYDVVDQRFYSVTDSQFETCQQDISDTTGKLVAFAFALYILIQYLKFTNDHNDEYNGATYLVFVKEKVPDSLGMMFLWGFTVNIQAQLSTTMSSLVLVYLAGDPLDMILNSLAILFVTDLDDMLATAEDYRLAQDIVAKLGWNDLKKLPLVASADTATADEGDGDASTKKNEEECSDLHPVGTWYLLFKYISVCMSGFAFAVVLGGHLSTW